MSLTIKMVLSAILALAVPLSALAQSNATSYCNALSYKYQRYVSGSNDIGRHHALPNAERDNAAANCATNPGGSIPVLERALLDAKVDLPPRG